MFTGIIEKTAVIRSTRDATGIRRVEIDKPTGWKLTKGQSVAVDGVCSTVVAITARSFFVEYMAETLSKTTMGSRTKGTRVNLERSLTLTTLLDGHLVQGHVDTAAPITAISPSGASTHITLTLPKPLIRYVAPRGSITIHGVSLTVARMRGVTVTVALIPHTLAHTTLGTLRVGDFVNVETDLVARYLLQGHKS